MCFTERKKQNSRTGAGYSGAAYTTLDDLIGQYEGESTVDHTMIPGAARYSEWNRPLEGTSEAFQEDEDDVDAEIQSFQDLLATVSSPLSPISVPRPAQPTAAASSVQPTAAASSAQPTAAASSVQPTAAASSAHPTAATPVLATVAATTSAGKSGEFRSLKRPFKRRRVVGASQESREERQRHRQYLRSLPKDQLTTEELLDLKLVYTTTILEQMSAGDIPVSDVTRLM